MPVQTVRLTQNANTTNENVLAGTKWEFPSRPTFVEIFGADDALAGAVQIDFSVANVIVGENVDLQTRGAGEGPLRNEDLVASGMAMPGDRIQIRTKEVAGVNTPYRLLINFTEA